jgi:hypothetical protein
MPYCPKCRCEYDEGVKTCYDCGSELVDVLEPEEKPAREAFLMTVADEMEFLVVESKLREYGIPAYKRYKMGGDVTYVYMGMTSGLDVLVPDTVLTQAQEIMAITPQQYGEASHNGEKRAKPSVITILLVLLAGYVIIRVLSALLR